MSFQNKDMLGISLIEMLKPNIKNKQNDYVIKTLGIVKDGAEAYLELLSVAIFHKNSEIIKLIIEKYINSEIDSPYINALCFFNSILSENSKYKLNDSKDNYKEVMCPFAIMAGIGGDIEIFKYLLSHNLISDINILGTIGLSKKYKNALDSNIIGACAYYGNEKLLEYLLQNYRSDLDINIYTTEKLSQKTKIHFSKELSGTSPAQLACAGPASDEKTIEILKILEDYKANFENKDFNDNNIIHISTRRRKINTLKFLINSLELENIMNEVNNDNMTPFDIAQQMKNQEIIGFFKRFGKGNEEQNEREKKELSEDLEQKSNKIIKKELNNKKIEIPLLLNYSEYQEDLIFNEEKQQENKNNNICLEDINNNTNITKIKKEKSEKEKFYKNGNNNNEVYSYNYSNNNKYKNDYNDNKNYKYKNNNYNYKKYENKNYKNNNYEDNNKINKYKNKNYENAFYENNNNYKNQKGYYNNNNYWYYKRNKNYFNKKYYENNENDNPTKTNFLKDKKENASNENTQNSNTFNNNFDNYKNNISNFNNNEIKITNNEQNEKDNNKKENKNNILEEDNEELEEGSFSEEDFLNEKEDKSENKEVNISEYNKLYKKYLDIERKCYNLEKTKKEICSYINKMNINKKINIKMIPNNEESINSLLKLTNIELESKDKYIKELKKDCIMADLTNIKNFNKEKLKLYKDFYIRNLKIINSALEDNAK